MTTFHLGMRGRSAKRYRSDLPIGHGYRCPKCLDVMETRDSRRTEEGYVRRRRKCKCGHALSTIESPEGLVEATRAAAASKVEAQIVKLTALIDVLKAGL